jgi:hypothetical protein
MRKTKNFALVLGAVLVLVAGSLASAQSVFQKQTANDGTFVGSSQGETLYAQLDDPSGSAFTDQAFEAVYAAYDGTGADDFQVTSAIGWDVTTLNTPGALQPPAGQVPFFVSNAFHADGGGIPGAALAGCSFPGNTSFTTDGTGDLSIDVTGCNLPPGETWVSQIVRLDFNPFGQHFWATRNTALGTPAQWQNPGDGFASGCTSWTNASLCGGIGADNLFEILGKERTATTTTTTTSGVPALGPLGIGVMLLALGGGSAYVLGRRRQA